MQQAQEKHGYYVTDRNMRFLSIRTKSRPDTQPIAEDDGADDTDANES